MRNKNIIFNHTLEEYNKRYRNRKQRLLKYTKKEVEEFDIKNKTDIKNFLLEDRKWWFIKDTYYEIPKAPRLVWFRNLNAGAQTGICLLGAGVIATAITVPLVLLNRTNGLSITIDGADYDKEASHIELHKKSTIKLKEKDKKIIGVEYVKVGDKTLESTEYTFDEDTKVVTINAEAMTSTKIEIKVKTENPHIVDLETWKEKADKLNADFLSSTLEYTLDQITKYVEEGQKKTLKKVEYYNDPLTGREFWVYFDESGGSTVATYLFSGKKLFENGYITDKGICEIYDDEIVYKNENAGDNEYKELHINKFGYPTYQLLGSGDLYEIEFNSEPQPKQETAKEKFLRLYKPYNDAFQNATTVYDATDVTVTIDGKTKIATSILYGKKTELIARKCSIDDNQCIAGGETDFEIDRFSKMLD